MNKFTIAKLFCPVGHVVWHDVRVDVDFHVILASTEAF
jgi:hypothetical protein